MFVKYPKHQVIGDSELPVQLAAHVIDFLLQHSRIV